MTRRRMTRRVTGATMGEALAAASAKRRSGSATRSRTAERRASLLSSYVAPEIVAHIMSDGRVPLPSGVRIPVTVLFADIRSFTRLAERLPAERVVAFLDDYFAAMSAAALAHGAIIDKLVGDAVMLLFGVPAPAGGEPTRALTTAIEMHRRFEQMTSRWRRQLPPGHALGLGVGCASGEVVLANVGSPARMDYTVIGAAVNLAARLAARAAPGVTLVDRAVRDGLSDELADQLRVSPPRFLALKGMRGRIRAFACVARRGARPPAAARSLEDPVCGMKLHRAGATTRTHGRRRYYFCSRACAEAFARDPGRYAAGRSRDARSRARRMGGSKR